MPKADKQDTAGGTAPRPDLTTLFPHLAGGSVLSPVEAARAAIQDVAERGDADADIDAFCERREAAIGRLASARSRGLHDLAVKLECAFERMGNPRSQTDRGAWDSMTPATGRLLRSVLRDVRRMMRAAGGTTG